MTAGSGSGSGSVSGGGSGSNDTGSRSTTTTMVGANCCDPECLGGCVDEKSAKGVVVVIIGFVVIGFVVLDEKSAKGIVVVIGFVVIVAKKSAKGTFVVWVLLLLSPRKARIVCLRRSILCCAQRWYDPVSRPVPTRGTGSGTGRDGFFQRDF